MVGQREKKICVREVRKNKGEREMIRIKKRRRRGGTKETYYLLMFRSAEY